MFSCFLLVEATTNKSDVYFSDLILMYSFLHLIAKKFIAKHVKKFAYIEK